MTDLLLLFLALAAIGAAGFFALRAMEAQKLTAGASLIKAERDRFAGEVDTLRKENARLSTDLASERGAVQARAEAQEAASKLIEKQLESIASKALDANQQRFLALANETFEKHKQAAAGSVKDVITPAQEALTKLATTVEAMEKARLSDKSALGETLRNIGDTMRETQKSTSQLALSLRASPKARGRWGEQTLRNVLELSGLAANVDFTEQVSTTDGEGARLRPDVVINLPGGRCIVVDSKVALSGYLDAMEATDEATREACLKKHAAELKGHVRNLASKDYWKHVPDTADFVVLFVPGENFLAAAAERDPNLFEDAFASKVIITTPSTMVALAKSVAYGWRQEQSAKNAQEIANLGREMHSRMHTMVDKMISVGASIEKTVKSYNDMVGSVESRVLPQARRFKELGAADAGVNVAAPPQIEVAPRPLSTPEQLDLLPPPQKRGR